MNATELGHKLYMELQWIPHDRNRAQSWLAQGADPNYDFKGFTLLMTAALRGDADLCRALIEAGADKEILYRGAHDAAFYAHSGRHAALAEWLERAPAPVWDIFDTQSVACVSRNEKLGLKLTQIFNFTAREKITLAESLTSGQFSTPAVEAFDALPPQQVERAAQRFKKLSGAA